MLRLKRTYALAGLVLGLVLMSPATARPERMTHERAREILQEAIRAYDEAVRIARSDPTQATALYHEAAASFGALVEAGFRNADVHYNLGNVYFRLGELGRAILEYRRAERLRPGDARLAANLRYARDRVEPLIRPSGQRSLARQLLFWHYKTSAVQRFYAMLALAAIGWALMFAWIWRRRSGVLLGGVGCIALAMIIGLSLHYERIDRRQQPHGVVVEATPHLRLGRSENADLALRQPLGPGVEVRILQQRGEWVEVRLQNDQTGWLPADSVQKL